MRRGKYKIYAKYCAKNFPVAELVEASSFAFDKLRHRRIPNFQKTSLRFFERSCILPIVK